MCTKTAGAERTGEWESHIWILRWIGEKANDAKTADGKKTGELESNIWNPFWKEEKVSAAGRLRGFLNK
jgi:hypothetical protein